MFGMSQAEFERGYMAFLKREAADGSKQSVKQLQKAVKDHPDDVAAAAALADADSDDLAVRKKLVQMTIDAKDFAAAEKMGKRGDRNRRDGRRFAPGSGGIGGETP